MTKKETKQTARATGQVLETVNTAIELSQDTANLYLDGAVKAAEVSGSYVRSAVKVGLDVQEAGVGAARKYFDGLAKVTESWLGFFAETGEKTITAVGDIAQQQAANAYRPNAESAKANAQA